MIRFLLISSFFLGVCYSSFAQEDIYSLSNSRRYAQYLLEQGRYTEALAEYKRIGYFHNLSESDVQGTLFAALCGEHYMDGITLFEQFTAKNTATDSTENLFKDLLLLSGNFERYHLGYMNAPVRDLAHDLSFYALSGNWKTYTTIMETELAAGTEIPAYHVNLYQQYQETNFKSPFVAGMFSTAVPGLGKIYTGEWKDGLFSMVALGIISWQTVRIFNKQGKKSVVAWGGATLGGVFYLSNIYGSARSAINVNHRKTDQLYEKIYRNSVPCR